MDQFKSSDLNLGLSESPIASWLNYDVFNTTKNENEDCSMEIFRTSDLEEFKELQNIEEVPQVPVVGQTSDEELKASIMKEFFPEEVKKEEFQNNNLLIAEVEKYLTSMSGENTRIEEDILAMSWDDFDVDNDNLTVPTEASMMPIKKSEGMGADQILEALTSGQVMDDSLDSNDSSITDSTLPSSFEALDANGEKVIILIAPPTKNETSVKNFVEQDDKFLMPASPASYSEAFSPSSTGLYSPGASSTAMTSDDDDWRPNDTTSPKPRKKYERKAPKRKPEFAPYPKDKAERKKAQNRSAAWKYREKKKGEQEVVEKEFETLLNRNVELKKTLSDMEIQLKCLKQLMVETGMATFMQ